MMTVHLMEVTLSSVLYDLRRQEAIIEEKEFELRKIVQRREKIEVGTS